MPIIKLTQEIKKITVGNKLVLLSDDPGIEVDFPAWCKSHKHQFDGIKKEQGVYYCTVTKKR